MQDHRYFLAARDDVLWEFAGSALGGAYLSVFRPGKVARGRYRPARLMTSINSAILRRCAALSPEA
jgi:hypothetical protein